MCSECEKGTTKGGKKQRSDYRKMFNRWTTVCSRSFACFLLCCAAFSAKAQSWYYSVKRNVREKIEGKNKGKVRK